MQTHAHTTVYTSLRIHATISHAIANIYSISACIHAASTSSLMSGEMLSSEMKKVILMHVVQELDINDSR